MTSSNTEGSSHWFSWLKALTELIKMVIPVFLVILGAFLIIERGMDVQVGLSGIKATRPETTLERNCRLTTQEATARDQGINGEILALQAQVINKDHDLSETRQRCLAADPNDTRIRGPANRSLCKTEISSNGGGSMAFATPQGNYETELTSIAEERDDLQSKIAGKENERAQWERLLDQKCLGIEAQEVERQR